MKRVFLFCLLALSIAGCSDEGLMGMSTAQDPVQEGDDAGGLFGDPADEGIPIEGDASPAKTKATGTKEEPDKIIKPVEIRKRAGSLGFCVIGEACEKNIGAKGGSKEYRWSLVGGELPPGLELADTEARRVKIKKSENVEMDQVGEFTFTLRVEDAADASRASERSFSLTINENIAMVLYTMGYEDDGSPVWTVVEEKDEDGNALPITVPPKGILLVEVIGHAESYRWSINGEEIVCNEQGCQGTKDGLTLYKDTTLQPPEPRPEHFEYMILKAEEGFIGQAVQSVTIAAAQDFGDPASKTISSITFEQDPCKIPMTVSAGTNALTKKRGEEYAATLTISGGKPPYSYQNYDDSTQIASAQIASAVAYVSLALSSGQASAVAEGNTITVSGIVPNDAAIDEPILKKTIVRDSCDEPHMEEALVTVTIDYPALDEEPITSLRLWAYLWTEWTNDETEVRFRIFVGNDLVASNDTGLNGDDPDEWKQFFPLAFTDAAKGKTVGEITEVKMTMHDDSDAVYDLEWEVYDFYLIGKNYYAVDTTGDSNNEVDGTKDVMIYTFSRTPGGEPDLHSFMDVEGGQIWRPCPSATECIDPLSTDSLVGHPTLGF